MFDWEPRSVLLMLLAPLAIPTLIILTILGVAAIFIAKHVTIGWNW